MKMKTIELSEEEERMLWLLCNNAEHRLLMTYSTQFEAIEKLHGKGSIIGARWSRECRKEHGVLSDLKWKLGGIVR